MSCQTIIVVERDAALRETLVDLLTGEGYRVRTATSAEAARAVLAVERHPCLILVDLLSAGMRGADFLAMRRADDVLLQIPVAVMSSLALAPDEAAQLAQRGASGYLRKPLDTGLLLAKVREFCALV